MLKTPGAQLDRDDSTRKPWQRGLSLHYGLNVQGEGRNWKGEVHVPDGEAGSRGSLN